MTETNLYLLELLKQEKTLNEICSIMNLSYKQVRERLLTLRKWGVNLKKTFYYDGEISYHVSHSLEETLEPETAIITSPKDTSFKALIISDLHLGSVNDRIDALDKIYNYAIKEDIHIILNAGDFIDGTFGGEKKQENIVEQIKYALDMHPYDKNILNFICLGNHDASSKTKFGLDMQDILKNNRPDLIPIGTARGVINVKNDKIIMRHSVPTINIPVDNNALVINGHRHETRLLYCCGTHHIFVPSLSDVQTKPDQLLGAFKMELQMKNGYFIKGAFNQLLIDSKIYVLNEIVYDLGAGKPYNIPGTTIMYEKERQQESNIAPDVDVNNCSDEEEKVKSLTQIDKFNARYKKN